MEKKEKEFFECIDFPPYSVANCSFKNLMELGIEYGTDVCPHTEDDAGCDDCIWGKETDMYPIIDDSSYLQLATIAFSNLEIKTKAFTEDSFKKFILDTLMNKMDDQLKRDLKEYFIYVYTSLSHTDFRIQF